MFIEGTLKRNNNSAFETVCFFFIFIVVVVVVVVRTLPIKAIGEGNRKYQNGRPLARSFCFLLIACVSAFFFFSLSLSFYFQLHTFRTKLTVAGRNCRQPFLYRPSPSVSVCLSLAVFSLTHLRLVPCEPPTVSGRR